MNLVEKALDLREAKVSNVLSSINKFVKAETFCNYVLKPIDEFYII